MKLKHRINEIYAAHIGQDCKTIEQTLDRDHFMSSAEARDFSLIDEVLKKREIP